MIDVIQMFKHLLPVAREAGEAIMEVYEDDFEATIKSDGSAVTKADKASEAIITKALIKYYPEITIISEENPENHNLKSPETFFLVDPLDGTKEFLKRDGEGSFTVNIALIKNSIPIMGIIYAPALKRMFHGTKETGAFENEKPINVRDLAPSDVVAVASLSHRNTKTDAWLKEHNIKHTSAIGSSLKFCLLACGDADIYPRFSPTMEWDTAAGDAILRAAGGMVLNPDKSHFVYGKADYKNDDFIATSKDAKSLIL